METEESFAIVQKPWNESLGYREDNQKNFASSPYFGGENKTASIRVTGVSRGREVIG